jgi:hypothetical protein
MNLPLNMGGSLSAEPYGQRNPYYVVKENHVLCRAVSLAQTLLFARHVASGMRQIIYSITETTTNAGITFMKLGCHRFIQLMK